MTESQVEGEVVYSDDDVMRVVDSVARISSDAEVQLLLVAHALAILCVENMVDQELMHSELDRLWELEAQISECCPDQLN